MGTLSILENLLSPLHQCAEWLSEGCLLHQAKPNDDGRGKGSSPATSHRPFARAVPSVCLSRLSRCSLGQMPTGPSGTGAAVDDGAHRCSCRIHRPRAPPLCSCDEARRRSVTQFQGEAP